MISAHIFIPESSQTHGMNGLDRDPRVWLYDFICVGNHTCAPVALELTSDIL